jgi:lambda family phage tail tape measure protein
MADIELTADGSQALATLKKIQDSVDKLGGEFKKFATSTTTSLNKTSAASDAFGDSLKALISIAAAQKLVSIADSATNLKNKLLQLSKSQAEANDKFNQIKQIADNSRSSLDATGTLYFRIAKSADDLGISSAQVAQITETMGKAISAAGLTTAEASGTMVQFSQALQSGVVQGDELRSMLESMPDVARALANELNTPIGSLKRLGSQGLITSRDLANAMLKAKESVDASFGKTNMTVAQSMTVLQNSITSMVGKVDEAGGYSKKFSDGILGLANAISSMDPKKVAQVADALINIGAQIAVVAGLAKSLGVLASAFGIIAGYALRAKLGLDMAVGAVKNLGSIISGLSAGTKFFFGAIIGGIASAISGISDMSDKFMASIFGMSDTASELTSSFRKIALAIGVIGGAFALLYAGAGPVLVAIGAGILKMLPFIGAVVAGIQLLDLGIKAAFDVSIIDAATEAVKNFFGASKKEPVFSGRGDAKLHLQMYQELNKEVEKKTALDRETLSLIAKQRNELSVTLNDYKHANDLAFKKLDFENSLIGTAEAQKRIKEQLFATEQNGLEKLNELEKKRIELQNAVNVLKESGFDAKSIGDSEEQKKLNAFNAVYLETKKQITAENAKQIANVKSLLDTEQQLVIAENARQFGIQQTTDTLSKMADITKQINQLGMSDIQKQIDDIRRGFEETTRQAIRLEEIRLGRNLTADEMKKYSDAAIESMTELIAKTEELQQKSSEFGPAWTQAFNNYANSATNAAKKAGDAFNAVTRGMESAIDRFVDTGKFSFSDMASSIIRDLIKIEMKAQAMELWKMIGGASSSGGIGGAISSFFGGFFADGGQPPMGKASIVGENGPELFVPRSAGTVIPNNQLGGGGGQTIVNNYNNYITNTVSAMDAKSVAQLFSENKKTLFGVVESARREVPMRG